MDCDYEFIDDIVGDHGIASPVSGSNADAIRIEKDDELDCNKKLEASLEYDYLLLKHEMNPEIYKEPSWNECAIKARIEIR